MTTLMPSPPRPSDSGPPAFATEEIRVLLLNYVRRRVPSADAEDVVQTILCDAVASPRLPDEPQELRRFLIRVAHNKVVDHFRRNKRMSGEEPPEIEVAPAPIEARELVGWAEKQAGKSGEAAKTLDWMAREGEGEKLESIAEEERVPATRVRQRVSRMRRWMKEKWLAELALVAAIGAVLFLILRPEPEPEPEVLLPEPVPSAPDPTPSPIEEGRRLRAEALKVCEAGDPYGCLKGLNEAAALDPAGDTAPEVQEARKKAEERVRENLKRSYEDNEKFDSLPPVKSKSRPTPTSTPTPTTTSVPPTPVKPAPQQKAPSKKPMSSDFGK